MVSRARELTIVEVVRAEPLGPFTALKEMERLACSQGSRDMVLDSEKYFNLGTQKRDGSFVDTAVWFVSEECGDAYFVVANIYSGKVKRIRNYSFGRVATCDWKGRVSEAWRHAEISFVEESDTIYRLFRKKYGLQFFVFEFVSKVLGKHKERQIVRVQLIA